MKYVKKILVTILDMCSICFVMLIGISLGLFRSIKDLFNLVKEKSLNTLKIRRYVTMNKKTLEED